MAAKGLLIDLPTAAIKTLAGIPFGDGKDEDSEEDKLLKKAIQSILSRQRMAASSSLTSAPYAPTSGPRFGGKSYGSHLRLVGVTMAESYPCNISTS